MIGVWHTLPKSPRRKLDDSARAAADIAKIDVTLNAPIEEHLELPFEEWATELTEEEWDSIYVSEYLYFHSRKEPTWLRS